VERVSRRTFLLGLAGGVAGVVARAPMALAGKKEVDIICRKAWGASPPLAGLVEHTIQRITVHHAGVKLTDNRDAPQRFRNRQAYHQSLGWPDIAYHVLVDRHGNVYQGRPRWAKGDTSTNYNPKGHLLVMCEGDFDQQKVGTGQMEALIDVLAWACRRYEVEPNRIRGHRDYTSTACPGQKLYARIEGGAIRRRVKNRLANGGVKLVELCGPAGKARVAAIEAGTD
jgi:hypothetical protein